MTSRTVRALIVAAIAILTIGRTMGPASATYAGIEGSGSTWAYTIVNQWIADVSARGMRITYNNNGSSQGRKDFANGVVDFADSDIPYQGKDPISGQVDQSSRAYAYLPVVAGGTAFTYHITVGGKLVNNLRLSGETVTKIFTNKITNWNDPQITKDNNGHAMPNLPIKPVVRSDGSGATAQLTLWMDDQYPSLWRPYNGTSGLTSLYPRKGAQIAASGDDGIMNTVSSAAGNGTIGYAEYSYPLNAKYPVAYVENKAGYFVQPTQYNVAVALTQAKVKGCNAAGACSPNGVAANDYLTQDLSGVYSYKDPRSYPVSSYSYMIIPTSSTDQKMSPAKRQTLADFLTYSICDGQSKAGPYGYSPLPLNLVQASFGQIQALAKDPKTGATTSGVTIASVANVLASCNNPTFDKANPSSNKLAKVAPQPAACQKTGAGPCGDGEAVSAPGDKGAGGTGKTGTTTGTTTGSTGTAAGGGTPTGTGIPGSSNVGSGVPGGSDDLALSSGSTAAANSIEISSQRSGDNKLFGAVAVAELLAVVLIPGLYVAWLRRRRGGVA